MNTRFVETFLTLARLGSFRATAAAMHATPAAISLRIKTLESELGVELIERDAPEFRLTASGERLLAHARTVVQATRSLQLAAQDETQLATRLRLGVIETVVHSWLPDYIRMLNLEYHRIVVDLTVDSSAVLGPRLRAGELDLVIQVEEAGDEETSMVSTLLASYPVRWIARSDLIPASRAKHVGVLLSKPVLTFGRGTAPQIAVEAIVQTLARRAGVPLADTQVTCMPSVAVIVKLLRDGYGIAAVPALFVEPYLTSGELGHLQVRPLPPAINVAMYYRDDADVGVLAAARVARNACEQYARAMGRQLIAKR
ncbi:LysR family transcriptional regulator [Paraburkholderia phenoliruptrix]|uniref:LysR family transcriptional regulator n=2 Tax=Paraburkholderia phenoliruptrix TaxID=252970 RepID=K0E1G9_9BURK|nr:LysR family transcriptional regulator [Paraburkholderia phenoliruptrix]AFT89549.1 LysR family transcriptional regulator [Paraburkholderia phenoliruptrix BR3459a]MDR6422638.1 DNA-binding transcriptional LysR family regulator [Paraburkholderia phenoliruptrix]CAB4051463.1 HTH-type transcriptional regulator HdfR [Paraburkholderia phenoliruptrix]